MRKQLTPLFVLCVLTVSACQSKKSPCDDKLLVLEGDGPIQVESQWVACVARNASKLASNQMDNNRLAALAVELCAANAKRYSKALTDTTPLLSEKQVSRLVEYKQESLTKIAISELQRARQLGCEAK